MKKIVVCAAVVLVAGSAAFAGDAKNGAKLYSSKCAVCHGKDGAGKSCPPLNKGLDAKKWKDVIVNGKKGKKATMPSYKGKLKDAEVEDILAHLQSLQPKKK